VRATRILFAWELGGNFGHVAKIAGVAERLAERGAACFSAGGERASRRYFFAGGFLRNAKKPNRTWRRSRPAEPRQAPGGEGLFSEIKKLRGTTMRCCERGKSGGAVTWEVPGFTPRSRRGWVLNNVKQR
jgi:hypothetical protein